ncbi:MAG: CDP-alcohol phosphatidyltransferase [Alphaproteobacteria bacterium]|nr:CDP-alcohol phosphatidyltransferase [Alphaproteobacteria bacterium]|tara:strand:- start:4944 stop:5534 length:591 start_codon:yes stop_codon:yes gene_type:complete
MPSLRDRAGQRLEALLGPIVLALTRFEISPNQVTIAGLFVNLAAAWLVIRGDLFLAGAVYLLGSGFDLLDGMLARASNRVTAAGAYLDSTLDRVSEGVVFAAIAYAFASQGQAGDAGMVLLALLGSLLVGYTRARAEAMGIACKVGIATRPERIVLLAFGLITGWLAFAIYVLVVLTGITVAQRIHVTLRGLAKRD